MAGYDDAEAVYDELGGVLRTVLANRERLAALQAADAVVQFALTEPDATLTFLARAGAPAALGTGATDVPADVVLAMPAATARALLFGERSPVTMLADGEIALKGSAAKLLQVLTALAGASGVEADPEDEPAAPGEEAAEVETAPAEEPAAETEEPAAEAEEPAAADQSS